MKQLQRINLNTADAKLIATSLLRIGQGLAEDIIQLRETIAQTQGRDIELDDLVQIPPNRIAPVVWKENFVHNYICFDDTLTPPSRQEVNTVFPAMFSAEEMATYEEAMQGDMGAIRSHLDNEIAKLRIEQNTIKEEQNTKIESLQSNVSQQIAEAKTTLKADIDTVNTDLMTEIRKVDQSTQSLMNAIREMREEMTRSSDVMKQNVDSVLAKVEDHDKIIKQRSSPMATPTPHTQAPAAMVPSAMNPHVVVPVHPNAMYNPNPLFVPPGPYVRPPPLFMGPPPYHPPTVHSSPISSNSGPQSTPHSSESSYRSSSRDVPLLSSPLHDSDETPLKEVVGSTQSSSMHFEGEADSQKPLGVGNDGDGNEGDGNGGRRGQRNNDGQRNDERRGEQRDPQDRENRDNRRHHDRHRRHGYNNHGRDQNQGERNQGPQGDRNQGNDQRPYPYYDPYGFYDYYQWPGYDRPPNYRDRRRYDDDDPPPRRGYNRDNNDPPPRRDNYRRNRRNNVEIDDDFEDDDRVRMTKYDGKVNWKAWFMQFDDIADRRRWNYTIKLGKLKELLKDDALAYFSRLPLNVRESYRLLCAKMNLRFGQKDTPRTAQTQLFVIKQKDEEELEEWAERCLAVSMDGWQDQSEAVAQEQAVHAFLRGAREKDSALAVMDKEPASIDDAVKQMRQATTNRQTFSRSGRSSGSIRTIYMEEDDQPQDVSFSEQDSVREIKKPFHNPNRVSFQDNKVKEMEREVSHLKEVLESRDKRVDEILGLLKGDKHSTPSPYKRDDFRSYSPQRNRYGSSYSPDRRSFSPGRRDYDPRYSRSPNRDRFGRNNYDDRRQSRYDRFQDRGRSRDYSPGYNQQREQNYQSDRSRDGRSYRSYDRPQYAGRSNSPNSQYRSPSRSPSPSFRRNESGQQSFLRKKEDADNHPKE